MVGGERPVDPAGSRRWPSCIAGRTFRDVTAMGQQVFGGIGFTVESEIQFFFRRAKQWQISWWDDRVLEELVAADRLDASV